MPLKPIFDQAPLMAMNALPLRAGLVRMENPAMNKLYQQIEMTNEPTAFEGAFHDLLAGLTLFDRFSNFANGIFDLTSLVYYISVAGLFVFFTVQSMEKKRWA